MARRSLLLRRGYAEHPGVRQMTLHRGHVDVVGQLVGTVHFASDRPELTRTRLESALIHCTANSSALCSVSGLPRVL